MQIDYKFISDIEPTDEQLHLLMLDVAEEVKRKAKKSNAEFLEQLQQLVLMAQQHRLNLNTDSK